VAAAIEQHHDKDGIIFPHTLAPFQALILPIEVKDEKLRKAPFQLYNELSHDGIEVILDHRDERPGIKFKDADLIGIPIRITIGPRGLKEGKVEVKFRKTGKVEMVNIEETADYVKGQISIGEV
jgi:prolyl-tRNA synthetase